MSEDSGDELNLRHFHCSRTQRRCDHRDVHNRKNCTCGTSDHLSFTTAGMSTLSENCNCGTPQFSARLGPTSEPAQQGHRPPCRRSAQQRARQQPCPRTVQRHPPPPLLPHHPRTHFGAPGAPPQTDVTVTVASLCTGLWGPAGAWVTLPKEATPDGQVLPGTTPRGSVTHHWDSSALHLQTPG